jgi:hypothetical protein
VPGAIARPFGMYPMAEAMLVKVTVILDKPILYHVVFSTLFAYFIAFPRVWWHLQERRSAPRKLLG